MVAAGIRAEDTTLSVLEAALLTLLEELLPKAELDVRVRLSALSVEGPVTEGSASPPLEEAGWETGETRSTLLDDETLVLMFEGGPLFDVKPRVGDAGRAVEDESPRRDEVEVVNVVDTGTEWDVPDRVAASEALVT